MEGLYSTHKYMLYERSARFATQTGVPLEELISEAHLIFCEAYFKYDPTKNCKFSTWLYNELNRHLYHFTKKFNAPQWRGGEALTEPRSAPEFTPLDLSEEAQRILDLLFSSPSEIAMLLGSPKLARGELIRWARKDGMSWAQIWSAFKELKEMFRDRSKKPKKNL